MSLLSFTGFIRDIVYTPCLIPKIPTYDISNFNINQVKSFGIITLDSLQNNIAFSKWTSPKRTRTYPFAKIYNTYHLNSKKVTVIPVIKDEGAGSDNNDRINYITLSWMNLLNVYIILAWYESAERLANTTDKITNQKFNTDYVKQKILEISHYQSTALHWNTTHFERDFQTIYLNAVNSYENIATSQNVFLHSRQKHIEVLDNFRQDGNFNLQNFKDYTLNKSLAAARRESMTVNRLEYLSDGYKGIFSLSNYLGGIYYLTADEVYLQGNIYTIQESKNVSKGRLPSEEDIKDGLFKLILFSNLEALFLNDTQVDFRTSLKITGNITGTLYLPNETTTVAEFCQTNSLSTSKRRLIELLNQETIQNPKLSIVITQNG
ncbi:hypothetical protein [Iningainema tapete]|uniref:Uncharacterized protein n=1 Tax=Iningainema tapete BLCC-T55 TaxID=2748662 RepID=A0A8J6XKB5_9CYAN|nr:hypothetical protein [Iningainema tapete]MBD2776213.1 hypothetical protein [Iningainema tapete BLCC-T55]